MGKIIWRELSVAFTIWLLILLILDSALHGFVAVVLPLPILGGIWLVNLIAWIWTKRS